MGDYYSADDSVEVGIDVVMALLIGILAMIVIVVLVFLLKWVSSK